MSKHSSQLETYYALRAPEYDRIYALPERQGDLALLRDSLQFALRGKHVLEVACGTGYWSEPVARVAASLLATDLSVETLEVARARAEWPAHVQFACADAYALAANEWVRQRAPFTAAFAGFWVSHVMRSRLSGFLAALREVLTPGAKVILFDNRFVEGSSTPIARVTSAGDSFQMRRLADGRGFEILKNFYEPTELREALTRAGGADHHSVRVELLQYYWVMRYETA